MEEFNGKAKSYTKFVFKSSNERIELARKAKEEGLSEEELAERDTLRKEYIAAFRANLKAQLDSIKFVDSVEEAEAIEESIETELKEEIAELETSIDELKHIKIDKDKIN